jgi:molybdopterin-containing oxidoreductase family membrane subunit
MLYIGSIGLFLTMIFLFIRVLPAISIAEMRELVAEQAGHHAEPAKLAPETSS